MITEKLWQELALQGADEIDEGWMSRRQYPDSHNDIWAGVAVRDGRRRLRVQAPRSAFTRATTLLQRVNDVSGVELEVVPAANALSWLHVTLLDPDLADVFTALADNLAKRASRAAGDKVVLDVLDQFSLWRKMMKEVARKGLSNEAKRGLYGELHLLSHHLIEQVGLLAAVDTWTGPEGTSQDFQLPTCAVEAKCTTSRNPVTVAISSEKQLDRAGTGRLFLNVVVVDERQGGSGQSLYGLVEQIRQELPMAAREMLDVKLAKVGYLDIHADKYHEPRYTVTREERWEVPDGFPCLTTENIPAGVREVKYKIDTSNLTEFSVDVRDFHSAVRKTSGDD